MQRLFRASRPFQWSALIALLSVFLLVGCNPDRWEHVDVQQIANDGRVVQTWEDVKILHTFGGGFLSGGQHGVRFKTKEGKQVSLMVPHRFIYR